MVGSDCCFSWEALDEEDDIIRRTIEKELGLATKLNSDVCLFAAKYPGEM